MLALSDPQFLEIRLDGLGFRESVFRNNARKWNPTFSMALMGKHQSYPDYLHLTLRQRAVCHQSLTFHCLHKPQWEAARLSGSSKGEPGRIWDKQIVLFHAVFVI
jgi:hypothetical protein